MKHYLAFLFAILLTVPIPALGAEGAERQRGTRAYYRAAEWTSASQPEPGENRSELPALGRDLREQRILRQDARRQRALRLAQDTRELPAPNRPGRLEEIRPPSNDADLEYLPPLEEELWRHGGSYLYAPEGDRLNWPAPTANEPYKVLRLPEDWEEPKPVTAFQQFLGADEIHPRPHLHWPKNGYRWEPRFVGYGSYRLFAFAFEQNNIRRDGIGHQLIADLDLRLTGTERFHVQYRPIGENRTGGSYYQFSDPSGYVNNMTAVPDRYWFEGEVDSMLGGLLDPFAAWDYHLVGGMYPLTLQNSLLMNDDILGFAVNKNNIYLGPLSNINLQLFAGFDDVDAFADSGGQVFGTNVSIDFKRRFYELTYAYLNDKSARARDSHFLAFSRTSWHGMISLAGRAMFKIGHEGGTGSGQLFVLESNYTRVFDHRPLGIEKGVFYANAFLSTSGWRPIAAGDFNRLTTAFEVNPLTQIAAGNAVGENLGAVLGVQLFRRHEDESLIPEIAIQSPNNEPVFGVGLRYLRKTSARSYFEVMGTLNVSDDPRYERRGIFLSETIVF